MSALSFFHGDNQYVRRNIPSDGYLSPIEKQRYRSVKWHPGHFFNDLADTKTKSFKPCNAT